MIKPIIFTHLIALFLFSCTGTGSIQDPPNILLIISDDQGWTDYSFMGHPYIETPRIDKLASEGMTFTRGYVVAPLCRPSLASIATGVYPHQHGVTGNDPAFDFEGRRWGEEYMVKRTGKNERITQNFERYSSLPDLLKEKGYLSIQTGKWWEGSWEQGGFTYGMTHGDPERGGRHGDEGLDIGRKGLQPIFDMIEEAEREEKPFFIWYAPFMPHSPHTPPEDLEAKYANKAPTMAVARYWAMCEWFDQTCGDLLDFIDEKGITEETMVLYVCDNGWIQLPDQPNRFAPRSKRSPYEMGIRTPIMVRWPTQISPKMDTTTLVSSIDLAPTILRACGIDPSTAMPGVNLLDANTLSGRTHIFSESYLHDITEVDHPTRSLTSRILLDYPWKLILPDPTNEPDADIELFNIAKDPHELRNVAGEDADRVEQLTKKVNEWWLPEHLLGQ